MMPEILTANATMFLPTGNGGGNPPVSFDPLDPDFLTFCDPADYQTNQRKTTDLLGELLPVGMDYLKHPASAFPVVNTGSTSNPNLFENIAANAQFVQIGMWYDELPASIGGIWAHFPGNWNAMAPTGMVRNLKGRLAAIAYRSHGSEPYHFVVYSYDERGRVEAQLRFTENLGYDAMYYKYNSMDQVISVTTADPARQHTTWYATDNFGRIKDVSTALSSVNVGLIMPPGSPARYMHPFALSKPGSPDIAYNYNNRGLVGTMSYPGIGTTVNYTYNSRAWLTSLIATDGSNNPIFSQSLDYNDPNTGYDGRGQIWGQTWQHGTSPAVTQAYDYDNVRRLIEWEVDGRRKDSYFYDKVGNRQQMLDEFGVPTVYSYAAGQNRMTGLTLPGEVGTMSYDANGAMTMREVRNMSNVVKERETLEYTTDGLLRLYHRDVNNYNGGNTRQWYYRYSAAGEREQKRMSDMIYTGNVGLPAPDGESIWVYYMLGADGRQHAVYHGTKVQREVCFGGGVQVLSTPYVYFYPTEYLVYGSGATANITMKRNAFNMWEKEYKIQDQLGSTRVVLNASGGVVSQYDYEPFGKVQTLSGSEQRLSWIDKEKDEESDLGDFGVRKYDDGMGRFMSIDPLWEKYRSLSPYHYVASNPLSLLDPNGTVIYTRNLTNKTTSQYQQAYATVKQWAVVSPTVAAIVNTAEGNTTRIDLYAMDGRPVEDQGTQSRNIIYRDDAGEPQSVEAKWNERWQALGLTISRRNLDEGVKKSDVMVDVSSPVSALALLDELKHATDFTNNHQDIDHKELYTALVNELDNGTLTVDKETEIHIRAKYEIYKDK